MENNTKIEVDEIPETEEMPDAWLPSGPNGTCEDAALMAKRKKLNYYRQRTDYRVAMCCRRCANCITFKAFRDDGTEYMVNRYCVYGDFETDGDCVCNNAYRSKTGRVRVVYDMRNAPPSVVLAYQETKRIMKPRDEGLDDVQEIRTEELCIKKPRASDYKINYVGGDETAYRRADGKAVEKSGGKIPRRLMN